MRQPRIRRVRSSKGFWDGPKVSYMDEIPVLRLLMEWMNFAYTSLPTPDSHIITEVVTEASLVAIL